MAVRLAEQERHIASFEDENLTLNERLLTQQDATELGQWLQGGSCDGVRYDHDDAFLPIAVQIDDSLCLLICDVLVGC